MNHKELLYGKQSDSFSLISVDQVKGNWDTLAIYYRDGDQVKKVHRKHPYYIYTDLENWEKLCAEGKFFPYHICNGPNPLNILYLPESYEQFKFLRGALPDDRCISVSGPQAFMVENMVNQFAGLKYDDVSRLYFDIEQISTRHFPDPDNPDDQVVIISTIYTYKDEVIKRVMRIDDYENEGEFILHFVKYLNSLDPDVLVHFNGNRYDIPVLEARCRLFGIEFGIGRDGSEPYSFPTKMKFAEKEVAYTNYNVHGRHVLDVWFMVMSYDVVKREMNGNTLKESAIHFGVAPDDRTYIEGHKITEYWHEKRDELLSYALDDVIETMEIDKILGQSAFYATQFIPLQHQDVARYGTGTKIESILTRAYIHHREAYPLPDPAEDYGGGFAYCPAKGYFDGPSSYADVRSLYPWLRKMLGIAPPKDTLGVYPQLMDLMNDERYRSKALADQYKKDNDPHFESEDSKQNSFKIYINTGNYGFLGFEHTGFNYYEGASLITETGQAVLKKMIELSDNAGYKVIRGDTDGILATFPSWDDLDTYLEFINREMRVWIDETYGAGKGDDFYITNDGEYEKGIIFDAKSYVLVERGSGKIKIKGNTLKSRAMEPFVKETLKRMVYATLDKDYELMTDIYDKMTALIDGRALTFKDIAKKTSLNMGKDEYEHKRESGRTHKIAAYELAYGQEHEIPYRKGDPIRYYVSEPEYQFTWFKNGNWKITRVKTAIADLARLEADWDGNYDREHYQDRLDKGVKRLLPIFGEEQFSSYFPSIKITKQDRSKLYAEDNSDEDDDN